MNGRLSVGLSLLAGIVSTFPASAQGGVQRGRQTPQQQRGALAVNRPPQNQIAAFRTAAESVAKHFEVKIVVDPAVFVLAKPKLPEQAENVHQALDQLVNQARKAAWKKVYLKGGTAQAVLPEKLGESLRALDAVEQSGIVVESPLTRRASTLIKNYEVQEGFDKELEAQQFDPGGVYVIYSTVPGAVAGKSLADRLTDMQRESLEMMMQLDDQQLQDTVQRGLDLFMNMDPSLRSKFMGMQMKAGMQAFMNMPPEQRNQLMQEMMGMFGGQGFPGAGGGGGGNKRP